MALKKRSKFIIGLLFALMLLILIIYFGTYKHRKEHRTGQIIYYTSNSFGEIWVDQYEDQRCLYFGDPAKDYNPASCICLEDLEAPCAFFYWQILGALFINPTPKKILMLGLGGGVLVNYLRTLVPEHTQFDVVEINPNVVAIAKEFFFLEENNKTRFFIDDAYQYVMKVFNANNCYDLIIVDVFDANYIPSHLLSPSFMEILKGVTSAERGVVAFNTFGISRTYDNESEIVAGTFGDFYHIIGENRLIFACNGDLPPLHLMEKNEKELREKFWKMKINGKSLLSEFVVYIKNMVV